MGEAEEPRSEADELLEELLGKPRTTPDSPEEAASDLRWREAEIGQAEVTEGSAERAGSSLAWGLEEVDEVAGNKLGNQSGETPVVDEPKRSRFALSILLLAAALLAAGGFGFWLADRDSGDAASGSDPQFTDTNPQVSSEQADTDATAGTQTGGAVQTDEATLSPAEASLILTLGDNFDFAAVGVVPDQATADAINGAVDTLFAQYGTADITVDPSVEAGPWIASAPLAVQLMPLLLNGSIELSNDETRVSGHAVAGDLDDLAAGLGLEAGFAPIVVAAEIVDLPAPWIKAIGRDSQLTLTGDLPNETVRQVIIDETAQIYGAENLVDETEIDPGTHSRFVMIRFGENVKAFSAFGDFEVGVEEDRFYGVINEGLNFDTMESEVTADLEQRLGPLPMLVGQSTLPVVISGHTDSLGTEAFNLALSVDRAQSVADFFVINGMIDPARLTVDGRGETEPIAPNTTEEGRAKNRRVEIDIGRG